MPTDENDYAQIVDVDWNTLDRHSVADTDVVSLLDDRGNVVANLIVRTPCRYYVKEVPLSAILLDLGNLEEHRQRRRDAGLTWEHAYRDRPIPWTAQRRRILHSRDRRACFICGHARADSVVRRVARADGGSDDEANLAAAHYTCHLRRSAAHVRRRLGTGPDGMQPPDAA